MQLTVVLLAFSLIFNVILYQDLKEANRRTERFKEIAEEFRQR